MSAVFIHPYFLKKDDRINFCISKHQQALETFNEVIERLENKDAFNDSFIYDRFKKKKYS